jgi:hypothetical protein
MRELDGFSRKAEKKKASKIAFFRKLCYTYNVR